jgi:hypothetical protein
MGIECVRDCDAKASMAIRDARWEIAEYYDVNRIAKAFDREWQKTPTGQLRGLQTKLRK